MQTNSTPPARYQDQHLGFDFDSGAVWFDSQPMTLTRKEQELLAALVRNEGEIVPREVLLDQVWGYSPECRTRTLDVHIRRLRKKLAGLGDRYIETIFGVGYRFQRFREPRYVPAPYLPALAMASA
ncbi:MAG: winged helix-turn-helix transcriptional regulator [Acidobacteria bacterium]|nr:winged helix-turn-helix transcriptional regulator [Acidobacteriota bacterium]